VRLGIGGGFLKFRNSGNFSTASGYTGGPSNSRERNQDLSRNENPFVSYEQIPTVASKKRVQAPNPKDTALSASTADYEFHPGD
jgi:hypothetical protein